MNTAHAFKAAHATTGCRAHCRPLPRPLRLWPSCNGTGSVLPCSFTPRPKPSDQPICFSRMLPLLVAAMGLFSDARPIRSAASISALASLLGFPPWKLQARSLLTCRHIAASQGAPLSPLSRLCYSIDCCMSNSRCLMQRRCVADFRLRAGEASRCLGKCGHLSLALRRCGTSIVCSKQRLASPATRPGL